MQIQSYEFEACLTSNSWKYKVGKSRNDIIEF